MDSLVTKKLLISALVAIVSILYINIRIKHKRDSLRDLWATNYGLEGGPAGLIQSCKELGQVLITYPSAIKSYRDVAGHLFNTDFYDFNVCKSAQIDICLKNNPEKCTTMDIKLFILQYFRELEKDEAFLKRRIKSKNPTKFQRNEIYDIFPDSEAPLDDPNYIEELKIFGMMIGLAIAHYTFLDITFENHFLCCRDDVHRLLGTLEYLDPQQYELYQKLYDVNTEKLKFLPDTNKPFRDIDDPNPLAVIFYRSDFPKDKAAEQIFIDPFYTSRGYIFTGITRILSRTYYNSIYDCYYRPNLANFNRIFSDHHSNSDSLNVYLWKDNSEYDADGKIFWRVIARLPFDDKLRIFQKVTGFIFIPIGSFSRLPKTKIIMGSGKNMFPEPFCIVIDPKYDEMMLEQELLLQSK